MVGTANDVVEPGGKARARNRRFGRAVVAGVAAAGLMLSGLVMASATATATVGSDWDSAAEWAGDSAYSVAFEYWNSGGPCTACWPIYR